MPPTADAEFADFDRIFQHFKAVAGDDQTAAILTLAYSLQGTIRQTAIGFPNTLSTALTNATFQTIK